MSRNPPEFMNREMYLALMDAMGTASISEREEISREAHALDRELQTLFRRIWALTEKCPGASSTRERRLALYRRATPNGTAVPALRIPKV